jgi:hypothetical protein
MLESLPAAYQGHPQAGARLVLGSDHLADVHAQKLANTPHWGHNRPQVRLDIAWKWPGTVIVCLPSPARVSVCAGYTSRPS